MACDKIPTSIKRTCISCFGQTTDDRRWLCRTAGWVGGQRIIVYHPSMPQTSFFIPPLRRVGLCLSGYTDGSALVVATMAVVLMEMTVMSIIHSILQTSLFLVIVNCVVPIRGSSAFSGGGCCCSAQSLPAGTDPVSTVNLTLRIKH